MIFLSHIDIHNFRNIKGVNLNLSNEFNVLYGDNGSGKTSFLEAVYHLSFGRSFKTTLYERVIRKGQDSFLVTGKVNHRSLGVQRFRDGLINIRYDQEKVKKASELNKLLPIQLINPDGYQLLASSSKIRRQFIDWGVFHVEHQDFATIWKHILKLVKQRNAALKNQPRSARVWDKDLIKYAKDLDIARARYLGRFYKVFLKVINELLKDSAGITIEYNSGWPKDMSYEESLEKSFGKDRMLGYTQYGPHKADLAIILDNWPAREILSRGQQKVLVCGLRLSQAILLKEERNINCVFLIDDLASELDEHMRELLIDVLRKVQAQVLVTGIEKGLMHGFLSKNSKLFHVEQGNITEKGF